MVDFSPFIRRRRLPPAELHRRVGVGAAAAPGIRNDDVAELDAVAVRLWLAHSSALRRVEDDVRFVASSGSRLLRLDIPKGPGDIERTCRA